MGPSDTLLERRDPGDTTITPAPATPAEPTGARLEFGALTHVGKVRDNNEDHYLIARASKALEILQTNAAADSRCPQIREAYLLLVADGMGGAAAGERASAVVVEEAQRFLLEKARWFYRLDDPDEEIRIRLLREALERVDRRLVEEGKEDPSVAGMGTTVTTAAVIDSEVFIVHVGDSRAYSFQDGRLEQLTTDHTLTHALVQGGFIGPQEARKHPLRHVLTNVLGCKPGVNGEILKLRLAAGDRLLLCTDGLPDMLTDAEIAEMLARCPRPQEACQALVDAALDRGGRDNITVLLAAYLASPEA
jgi:protein phosphatase